MSPDEQNTGRRMPILAFTSQDTAYSASALTPKHSSTSYTPLQTAKHDAQRLFAKTHEPAPISGFHFADIIRLLVDVGGILAMALFVCYSAAIYTNSGQSISPGSVGHVLLTASQYGPTVFTMVFAMVVSGALRNFTVWRIQSKAGISVGAMSRFLGSGSFSGALTTQMSFGLRSSLAFLLIFVWCLSPLGSQASLRVVYSAVSNSSSTFALTALDTFSSTFYSGASSLSVTRTTSQPMMIASMLAYDFLLESSQDIWGNIRVPAIDYLNYTGSEYEWIDLSTQETTNYYSSLIGIPIRSVPDNGTSKFIYNGSYISFDCYSIETLNMNSIFTNFTDNTPKDDGSYHCGWESVEGSGVQFAFSKQDCSSDFASFSTNVSWPKTQLVWESKLFNGNTTRANCSLSTSYVDTEIECSRQTTGKSAGNINCSALRTRRSPSMKNRNSNITVFDIGYGKPFGTAGFLAELFPNSLESGGINPLVTYIDNPSTAVTSSKTYNPDLDISTVPKHTFEQGLMQLLNTANYVGVYLDASAFLSSAIQLTNQYADDTGNSGVMTLSAANMISREILGVHKLWLAFIFFTSLVGLLFAVLSLIFQHLAAAPQSFSPISCLFLPNRLDGVRGVSSWEADTWIEKNHETMLFMGDIEPSAEIGQIALTTSMESEPLGHITKDRLYK